MHVLKHLTLSRSIYTCTHWASLQMHGLKMHAWNLKQVAKDQKLTHTCLNLHWLVSVSESAPYTCKFIHSLVQMTTAMQSYSAIDA